MSDGVLRRTFSSWADAEQIADKTAAAIMGNSEVANRKQYERVPTSKSMKMR